MMLTIYVSVIVLEMNQIQLTATLPKAYELEANATDMSTAENYIYEKKIRKGTRRAKHNETLIIDDAEATDQTSILDHIKDFYETVFKKREQKTTVEIKCFPNAIDVPSLSEDQVKLCKEDLTEKVLWKSLRSMQNDKYPVNNDVKKDFYETIWDELKEIFVDSVKEAKEIGHLSTSQQQTLS